MKDFTLVKLFSILIFFSPGVISASTSDENPRVPRALGVKPHYGFIILHSEDLYPVKDSYPYGLGLELSWHYDSKKAYDRCLCFPRLGVSATYWNYDSPEILGEGMNALFFVEPFFGVRNKLSFSFRGGLGLAYASMPYDEMTNPENLSYSTRFSFALQVAAGVNCRINKNLMTNLSANYNHISNGGMKDPNKGINYPTVSFGLDYYLNPPDFQKFTGSDWRNEAGGRNRWFFSAFGTKQEVKIDYETKSFPAIGLNTRFSRQLSRINALVAGAELMGDWGNKKKIEQSGEDTGHGMAGLFVGNDFLLGRFIFGQQFAAYIYNPYGGTPDVYQRYFLDFIVTNHLTAGVGLKAHGHVADFLDFRVGFFW